MTKRILSLVFTFAMVLVALFQIMPLTAFAAVGDTFTAKITVGGSQVDCTFKILSEPSGGANGTVQIGDGSNAAITGNPAGELTLPQTVTNNTNTYNVTVIGNSAFRDCTGFTGSLTIPGSVTTIGSNAFFLCSGFTGSLTIPVGVNTIGNYAFFGCSGFTGSLTIPVGVTIIGNYAFFGCSGLTGSLTISEGVNTIGANAFEGCTGLTGSLTIPGSVITIGHVAFAGCSGFTGSLTIPEGVTTIGDYAFYDCSGFTGSLTIPESVTSIGDFAFYNCTSIQNLILAGTALPNNMGSSAFSDTTALNAVYVYETWQGGDSVALPGITTPFTRISDTLKTIYNLTDDNVTIADAIYNGSAQQPAVTVTANGTTVPSSEYTLSSWTNNTNAGTDTASVKVTANKGSLYIVGSVNKPFSIVKSDITFDGGVKAYKGSTQTTTFTYGDIITVRFTPQIAAQTFALTPPSANQAALFIGTTQLTAPVNVAMGSECVLTYDTTAKLISATGVPQTLTVKYVGTGNLNDSQGTVSVTVNKKALTGGTITAGQSKMYDGTDTFSGINVTFDTASGVVGSDTVTATVSGTVADKNVGANKALTVTSAVLDGAYAGYYILPTSLETITGNVDITKASGLTATTPDNIPMVKNKEKAYTYDLSQITFNHNDTGTRTFALGALTDNNSIFKTVPSVNGYMLSFESNMIATTGSALAVQVITVSSQNYNDTTINLSFDIIDKMPITISGVSIVGVAADDTVVYNGAEMSYTGTPTFSETGYDGTDLVYEWHDASGVLSAAPKNVGSYFLKIYIPATNTAFIGSETIPFAIIKKDLTITADNQAIGQGDAKPTYTATPQGLAATETITGVSFTDDATDTNTVGIFTITPSGGTISGGNANYNISYVNGALTINPKYTITIGSMTNGSVTAMPTSAIAGTTIGLTVSPSSGYRLVANSLKYNGTAITGNSFVMPSADVTITAEFELIPPDTYNVTVSSMANGVVTAIPTSATVGTTINLTVTPNSGYQLKAGTLKYNGTVITGNSFAMPATNVTITAEFELIPSNTYTVSVVNGTGSGNYAAGATVTISANYISNYSFTHWTASGVTLANQNSSTTTFVMPSENVSVTANYSYNGGGNNGGDSGGNNGGNTDNGNNNGGTTTPSEPVIKTETNTADKTTTAKVELTATVKGTTAKASVSTDLVNQLIAKSIETAEKAKTTPHVEINVAAPANAKSVELTLPKTGVASIAKDKINDLSIGTPFATIRFNSKALASIANTATSDITVTASVVDKKTLPEATQLIVGNKPVYDFTVTSGNKVIPDFGNGKATITIPYTLEKGEKANSIVIYYVNDKGALEVVKNCKYDSATKTVSFVTTHFSRYAIAYKPVSFNDVSGSEWFGNAVDFVAARELFGSMGEGNFGPNSAMTRAMFVTVLARLDGVDLSKYKTSKFSDVDINEWYGKSVAWATSNSIVGGIGNNMYAPNREITREEMATMLYNYMKYKDITLPDTGNNTPFNDTDNVSAWAQDAVVDMKRFGIIGGVGGNNYAPKDTANRASVATIFMNFINALLKR